MKEIEYRSQRIIAFDFDETISLNSLLFLKVMRLFREHGFVVVIATWRYSYEYPEDLEMFVEDGFRVFYTGRKAKRDFLASHGYNVDVWVDDNPLAILADMGKSL